MAYLKIIGFLCIAFLFSCDKKESKKSAIVEKLIVKEVIVKEFGFTFNDFQVIRDTIKTGDTFGGILGKYPLPDSLSVHQVVEKVRDSFNPRNIRIGKPYLLFLDKKAPNKLQTMIYVSSLSTYTVIDLRDSIMVSNRSKPVTIKRRTIASNIEGSLSASLNNAGVDASLASKLAKVYEFSIDFFKIQKNDKFSVTINERFIDDTVYTGIQSVESTYFEHKGKSYYAFPYKLNKDQKTADYYDESGKGLRSMFLKSPLDYFRISSKFTGRRFHPVQKTWKAHNGTDYAAAHGTPIKTTASGTVERTGYTAGNGNYVKVRHNNTYSTQYLHMSKILVKQGQRVSQGQVIGKVGSTGLATGPHVCYRFWKNGVQVDPFKQKLPNTEPMSDAQKDKYLLYIAPLKRELDSIMKLNFDK